MKYYKTFNAFKKRVIKAIDWSDTIRIGKKRFTMYEYGDSSNTESYAYFLNKGTTDMIYIKYILPSINGARSYSLIEATYTKNYGKENLWRA